MTARVYLTLQICHVVEQLSETSFLIASPCVAALLFLAFGLSFGLFSLLFCWPMARDLKPLPNGASNSSQVFTLDGAGYRLATHMARVGVGLNLIKLKFSPNSSHIFLRLATSANFLQVVLLLLCEYAFIFRQLSGFLASWLDLAVPFGHPPMQAFIL